MANPASPLHRGDVVLVPFPFTDLTGQKVRPAVIISPDPQRDDVLIAFISSVVTTHPSLTEVLVDSASAEFPSTGLKRASVMKTQKLLTLHRSLILRKLGHLGTELTKEMNSKLLRAIGLS